MKVRLINHTPAPDETVYRAARTCYQAGSIEDIKAPTQEGMDRFIQGLIKSGHTSTLEHVSFTFAVEGISRVVSHELVRHRIASYSQQSQRYCEAEAFINFYVPASIVEGTSEQLHAYFNALNTCKECYQRLIAEGIPKQDARYILPGAMPTQIVVTMNARSLLNFFKLRCCRRAQPEMQELAFKMLAVVKEVAPVIFKAAGRQCATCTEERKCDEADR